MFIGIIDIVELEKTIPMLVSLLDFIFFRLWPVDLEFGSRLWIAGVDLVKSIDKRSIFGHNDTTNRYSALRAFQNDTHRLDTTNTSQDINFVLIYLFIYSSSNDLVDCHI